MRTQQLTFEHLIAPVGRERFFSDYFGKKPLHIESDATKLAGLFAWRDFNALLAEGAYWTGTNLTLVANGQALKAEDYCADGERNGAFGLHRLDREKLLTCPVSSPHSSWISVKATPSLSLP